MMTTTYTITHIPLEKRKVLYARYIICHVFKHRPWPNSEGAEKMISNIQDELLDKANQLSDKIVSDNTDTLYKVLNKLPDIVSVVKDKVVEKNPIYNTSKDLYRRTVGEVQDFMEKATEQITNDLKLAACERCLRNVGRCCNGSSSDSYTVDTTGYCFSPFKQVFKYASTLAEKNYTHYAQKHTKPYVYFTSGYFTSGITDDKIKRIDMGIAATGLTKFTDKTEFASQIHMIIDVNNFDWLTYKALLYIMFHECFCHAYQGINAASKPALRKSSFEDYYTEGWMDFLAFELLERIPRITRDRAAAPKLPRRLGGWYDVIEAGRKCHDARQGNQDESHLAAKLGCHAAKRALERLGDKPRGGTDPWDEMMRFSCSLNLENLLSVEQKNALVQHLCGQLNDPDEVEQAEALYCLRAYPKIMTIEELLKKCEVGAEDE